MELSSHLVVDWIYVDNVGDMFLFWSKSSYNGTIDWDFSCIFICKATTLLFHIIFTNHNTFR